MTSNKGTSNGMFNHGHCPASGPTPMYQSWAMMISRCTNPNVKRYVDYGARGIRVCDRWMSFANFLEDMGNRPEGKTLDRINNDGNYEPGNCRWATRDQQARNTRQSKLTALDVVLLRQMWIRSGYGMKAGVAAAFGITVSMGRNVARRTSGAGALAVLVAEVSHA